MDASIQEDEEEEQHQATNDLDESLHIEEDEINSQPLEDAMIAEDDEAEEEEEHESSEVHENEDGLQENEPIDSQEDGLQDDSIASLVGSEIAAPIVQPQNIQTQLHPEPMGIQQQPQTPKRPETRPGDDGDSMFTVPQSKDAQFMAKQRREAAKNQKQQLHQQVLATPRQNAMSTPHKTSARPIGYNTPRPKTPYETPKRLSQIQPSQQQQQPPQQVRQHHSIQVNSAPQVSSQEVAKRKQQNTAIQQAAQQPPQKQPRTFLIQLNQYYF